jgi:hypothetical protein
MVRQSPLGVLTSKPIEASPALGPMLSNQLMASEMASSMLS